MGTRSLTVVFEPEGSGHDWDRPEAEIIVMYRQYDGYITGHGHELADFLIDGVVVNGLTSNPIGRVFNGMSCLAAQVVAHFKTEPGGFYLHPSGSRELGEEYVYEVRHIDGTLQITVIAYEKVIFSGSPQELLAFDETEVNA